MSPEEAVDALETMSLQELREEWRRRFGAPPTVRSPELVRRSLAWLIQTAAYGGIDPALRRQLRGQAARGVEVEEGARIAREWQGQRHEVEKVEDGYLYAGRRWKSLSVIATAISGVKRNGPKFFGMRAD